MKEHHLPVPPSNPSQWWRGWGKRLIAVDLFLNTVQARWGKRLLVIGLLLVTAQGFFQLYETQTIFFPGAYYENELYLIGKEYFKMPRRLARFQAKLVELQQICHTSGPRDLNPSSQSSAGPEASASVNGQSPSPIPGWEKKFYMAKKEKVTLTSKLYIIGVMLDSMQRALEDPLSASQTTLSLKEPERKSFLSQIREFRGRLQVYEGALQKLSVQFDTLAGCGGNFQ